MADLVPANSFIESLLAEMRARGRTAQTLSFPAGQIIFSEGDAGDGIYIVENGVVEILAKIGGEERRVLARLEPRAFFGEMAVMDHRPRSATAIAERDTSVSFISRADVFESIEKSPKLALALMTEFVHRMRDFDRRYLQEVLQAERLALVGRFAQSIVHDFKNPLNMIGFAADVACAEDTDPEIRHETKVLIRKQIDRLSNMIGELLEFTRGSSRSGDLASADYRPFAQQMIADIQPEAAEKQVTVECENEPPEVMVALDQTRLIHVFYNLIHNAIDAMPEGGKIAVRFQITESEVITEIEDTGPGIAPEIASRLFEPFATYGKSHGTGLGLSICKRIIEDHKGRIGVRGVPGRGAIFSIALPRLAEA